VETFHVVSECKTAVYFRTCLIQPVQLFFTVGHYLTSLLATAGQTQTNNYL
jgi:hypothetical protein